jgi:hypothetical protein
VEGTAGAAEVVGAAVDAVTDDGSDVEVSEPHAVSTDAAVARTKRMSLVVLVVLVLVMLATVLDRTEQMVAAALTRCVSC